MIKLKDVSKYYNSNGIVTVALEHINLEFNRGDIVAITGESGSGKSTLLNIICGNDNYDDGEIYFYQDETSYFDVNDLDNFRNKYVGFIYQNYNIIENYTVLQNVMLPLLLKGLSKKEAKTKALELIKQVGLENRSKHKGTKLSGGEKQRVVIARALAKDPDILACDEPTGNLDSKTSQEIINLIKEVAKDKLVLIVTHNYEEVKEIATRKVTLVDGHIIEDKILKEVSEDKEEKLELEVPKIPFKDTLYFVKNNILGTPKKTIFIFLIMFIACFTIISLIQSINYTYNTNKPGNVDAVCNYDPNYIIVNHKDKTPLVKDDFENYINSQINWHNYILNSTFRTNNLDGFMVTNLLPSYFDLRGTIPESSLFSITQGLLILPSDVSSYSRESYIGEFIYASPIQINIVGVCNSLYVNSPVIYVPNDLNYIEFSLRKILNNLSVSLTNFPNKPVRLSYNEFYDNPILYLPNTMHNYGSLDLRIANLYSVDLEYDVVYSGTVSNPSLYIPTTYILEELPIYEVGIMSSDVKNDIKALEKLGYSVYYPYENKTVNMTLVLTLLLMTLFAVVPAIFLYFITYIVVKIIYLSKFKDFMIMRSIGLGKKEMRLTLGIETFTISLLSSILTLIISILFGYIFNIDLYTNINSYFIIAFFVIMLLFSIVLVIQLNRKMFKYTTAKSFKEV